MFGTIFILVLNAGIGFINVNSASDAVRRVDIIVGAVIGSPVMLGIIITLIVVLGRRRRFGSQGHTLRTQQEAVPLAPTGGTNTEYC